MPRPAAPYASSDEITSCAFSPSDICMHHLVRVPLNQQITMCQSLLLLPCNPWAVSYKAAQACINLHTVSVCLNVHLRLVLLFVSGVHTHLYSCVASKCFLFSSSSVFHMHAKRNTNNQVDSKIKPASRLHPTREWPVVNQHSISDLWIICPFQTFQISACLLNCVVFGSGTRGPTSHPEDRISRIAGIVLSSPVMHPNSVCVGENKGFLSANMHAPLRHQ